MRIFRTVVLLTGVAILMPSPPNDAMQQDQAEFSAPGMIGSATLAFSDAASFCNRQPQVCETAGYVAGKMQAKAKYSVRLIYEWAAESSAEPQVSPFSDQASADPIRTGSVALAKVKSANGQSTLRIEDLIPAWRGPVQSKKS